MKILCTGDLHINDWMEYSKLDSAGRPSRLLDYLKLADTINDLCDQHGVKTIILAGDISESSIQRPRVHDIIGDFLRKLSHNDKTIYLIHGQHDCDTKEQSIMKQNSILTEICKDLTDYKINYISESSELEINGYKFYFQGWNQGHSLPESHADVFVGHGMVKGCTNLDGYVFINGFDQNELLEKFRLSVIGDIHNKQEFWSEDKTRVALQPGAPIQNTWKDAVDCGLWIADLSDTSVNLEFFNIHTLSPNTFHKFTYDETSTELVHSRSRIKPSPKKIGESKKVEVTRDLSVIKKTCLNLTKDKEYLHPLIDQVLESIQINDQRSIAESKVLKLKAENFLSIDYFELDFDEFPDSCVIVGKNGHGKSTISEAIYWCLTGTTTKSIASSNILNKFKKAEHCYVELGLEVNGEVITVLRKRTETSSHLELRNSKGEPFRRGSIRETQNDLYSLLGLKQWQIFMFSYFSAETPPIFNDLGSSAKNDLVSQIVGMEFVESMREYSKNKKDEYKLLKSKISGSLTEKEGAINNNKKKLNNLKEQASQLGPKLRSRILSLEETIEETSREIQVLELKIPEYLNKVKVSTIEELEDLVGNISKKYHSLQSRIDSSSRSKKLLESSLRRLDNDISKSRNGECPTCGQPTNDIKFLDKMNLDRENILAELSSIPNEEDLLSKVDTFRTRLGKLDKLRSLVSSTSRKLHDFMIEKSRKEAEVCTLKTSLESEVDTKLIEFLEAQINEDQLEASKLTSQLTEYQKLEESWKFLETSLFKKNGDLAKELNKQGSRLIQSCIDEITSTVPVTISIDLDLNLFGKFQNNSKVSYTNMSSGQRRLTDIAMMVALNNLFSKLYHLNYGVLGIAVYDEILSFLDEEYIQIAKHFVDQSLSRKVLTITHDHALMNMFSAKIKVKMGDTGSSYIKSWD